MKLDIHIHTRRYSPCSDIDPFELLPRAAEIGLSGLALVEHNALWRDEDIDLLKRESGMPGLHVFPGAEIRSKHGDLLIFGLKDLRGIQPWDSARDILKIVHGRGGAVVVAHPTRYGMGFDPVLLDLDFDGMEVMSTNMCAGEQDEAFALSSCSGIRGVGASDAHTLRTVGNYYTVFDGPVDNERDFVSALRAGRFKTVLEGASADETTDGTSAQPVT